MFVCYINSATEVFDCSSLDKAREINSRLIQLVSFQLSTVDC